MSDNQNTEAIRQFIEADKPPPDPAHLLGGSGWRPKRFRIAVMGEGGVGKRSIVSRWQLQGFHPDYRVDPTEDYTARIWIGLHGRGLELEVDRVPLESASHRPGFLSHYDACVYVYTVTNARTLDFLRVMRDRGTLHPNCIVLGNKSDLERELWEVSPEMGHEFNSRGGTTHRLVSAKTEGGCSRDDLASIVSGFVLEKIRVQKLKEEDEEKEAKRARKEADEEALRRKPLGRLRLAVRKLLVHKGKEAI